MDEIQQQLFLIRREMVKAANYLRFSDDEDSVEHIIAENHLFLLQYEHEELTGREFRFKLDLEWPEFEKRCNVEAIAAELQMLLPLET